jgi:hypothetical protein
MLLYILPEALEQYLFAIAYMTHANHFFNNILYLQKDQIIPH